MSEWKEVLIDNLCEVTSSKRIFYEEYVTSGIPFFRSKEIIELSNKQMVSTDLFITKEKFNSINDKFGVPAKDDILLTSVGTLGIPYLVPGTFDFYFKDGNLTWFRKWKNEINPLFFYWWLKSPLGYQALLDISIGSTQQALTISGLKGISFLLPPLQEQERIAEVLSSLDDKIDLLHRNNKTLEQLAETLFRQWFVEDTSASEKTIGEITKITSGKSLNRSHFLEKGTYPIYGSNGIIGWTDNYSFDENLIITGRVGTLGTVKIIDEKCWISDNVLIIKPNSELYKYPIYFSMKGYDFESLNVGSTQPLLTQGELNKQLVVILDEDKLLSCKMYFDELFNKIKLNLTQIQQLETLRDTLLPKLMSGAVIVV